MGICRDPPLMITEYIELGSLSSVLHSSMHLTAKELLRMGLDICQGLLFLHSSPQAILHRDLKSDNCLVDSHLRVKICDFGLARFKNTVLKDTNPLGTFAYMAPEVVANQKYSSKSDVYAFGMLLWEIIYRLKPFEGLDPVQIVYQVVNNVINN